MNYKTAYAGISEVNENQAKRFLCKMCKIFGNLNNMIETIISVDTNNTNEGGEYLELESPDQLTHQAVYIAHNMRVIELLNAFLGAKNYLDQTVNSTSGLAEYSMANTDMHIQNLAMMVKLLPQIKITLGSGTEAITTVTGVSPNIESEGVENLEDDIVYNIAIGTKKIPVTLFAFGTGDHARLATYYVNSTYNATVTLPLMSIMRSVCKSVENIVSQLKRLCGETSC